MPRLKNVKTTKKGKPASDRPGSLGPLYDLLNDAFPDYRNARNLFDVYGLAESIGMTPQGVYKAFASNVCTPNLAKRLVEFADDESVLSYEDLYPFIFK